MTDRELADALRNTTSRSKRKLLDAAADRIESSIRAEDAIICGFPVRDLIVAATVMRRSGVTPEDLRELCHNLGFAIEVIREEQEKTVERAVAEMLDDGPHTLLKDFKPLGHSLIEN